VSPLIAITFVADRDGVLLLLVEDIVVRVAWPPLQEHLILGAIALPVPIPLLYFSGFSTLFLEIKHP
jgi:hypothetical protein